jgi:hypothetical protein
MTIQEAKDWISKQEFKFANSYAKTYPHSYLHKDKADDKQKFVDFLKLIRKEGVVYTFLQKQYVYLHIEDHIYWEVGRPIPSVIILNKAPVRTLQVNKQNLAYENIANELKTKLEKRELYLENLLAKEKKTNNDLNQINFLMNTTRRVDGGGKNIIDNYKINIRYE